MWISFPSCLNIDSSTKTFSLLKTRVLFGCPPFTVWPTLLSCPGKARDKAPASELMHLGQCWFVIMASLPYLFLSRWKGSHHCCLEMLRYLAPETTSCECNPFSKWFPQTWVEQAWKATGTSPQPHLTCGQGRVRSVLLSSPTENVEERSMCSFRKGHNTHLAFGVSGYRTFWKSLDKEKSFQIGGCCRVFPTLLFWSDIGSQGRTWNPTTT